MTNTDALEGKRELAGSLVERALSGRTRISAVRSDGCWLIAEAGKHGVTCADNHEWEHLHNGTTSDIGLLYTFYGVASDLD